MVRFTDGNLHSFIHKIVIVALTCAPHTVVDRAGIMPSSSRLVEKRSTGSNTPVLLTHLSLEEGQLPRSWHSPPVPFKS